ncbi:hypothetical protein ACR78Z_18670 [Sphingobacterium thalpophilum]|uniref:Lipoprotein n=1 Tax=Sphingobacterium thalpophilum TaxID=259 RepID=A0A4U9UGX2_9SPHI|nr:hypothetical protein [Sphingobacterium thalpophilum]VTR32650.1 Uncharacterised protein [Sphingobacterium thalpophilum]
MRNLILIFGALLINVGCTKNDNLYFKADTMVEVVIVNDKNEDLLNQKLDIPSKIHTDKLKIEASGNNDANPSPTGGKLVPDMLSPEYFTIREVDGKNRLILNFYPTYSTSVLKLVYDNEGFPPDELKAELTNKSGTVVYEKLYLNGKLVWDGKGKEKLITIQKGSDTHPPL